MDKTLMITYIVWLLCLFVGFVLGGLAAFYIFKGVDGYQKKRVQKKKKKHNYTEKRIEQKYQKREIRKKQKKEKAEKKREQVENKTRLEDRMFSKEDRKTSYTDLVTATTGTDKKEYILAKRGEEDSSYGIVKRRMQGK